MILQFVEKWTKGQQDRETEYQDQYRELIQKAVEGKEASPKEIERILGGADKSPQQFLSDVALASESHRLNQLAANYETLEKSQRDAYRLIKNLEQERQDKIKEAQERITKEYGVKIEKARRDHGKVRSQFLESQQARDTLGLTQQENEARKQAKKEELQETAAKLGEAREAYLRTQNQLKDPKLSAEEREKLKKIESQNYLLYLEADKAQERLKQWS